MQRIVLTTITILSLFLFSYIVGAPSTPYDASWIVDSSPFGGIHITRAVGMEKVIVLNILFFAMSGFLVFRISRLFVTDPYALFSFILFAFGRPLLLANSTYPYFLVSTLVLVGAYSILRDEGGRWIYLWAGLSLGLASLIDPMTDTYLFAGLAYILFFRGNVFVSFIAGAIVPFCISISTHGFSSTLVFLFLLATSFAFHKSPKRFPLAFAIFLALSSSIFWLRSFYMILLGSLFDDSIFQTSGFTYIGAFLASTPLILSLLAFRALGGVKNRGEYFFILLFSYAIFFRAALDFQYTGRLDILGFWQLISAAGPLSILAAIMVQRALGDASGFLNLKNILLGLSLFVLIWFFGGGYALSLILLVIYAIHPYSSRKGKSIGGDFISISVISLTLFLAASSLTGFFSAHETRENIHMLQSQVSGSIPNGSVIFYSDDVALLVFSKDAIISDVTLEPLKTIHSKGFCAWIMESDRSDADFYIQSDEAAFAVGRDSLLRCGIERIQAIRLS